MWQEVYGGLEEPDGLAGLVRLRAGGPCPADTRLAAEKAGAWSEALSLHEQVITAASLHSSPGGMGKGWRSVVGHTRPPQLLLSPLPLILCPGNPTT